MMFSFGLAYLIEAIRSLLYSNMSIICDLYIYIYLYYFYGSRSAESLE